MDSRSIIKYFEKIYPVGRENSHSSRSWELTLEDEGKSAWDRLLHATIVDRVTHAPGELIHPDIVQYILLSGAQGKLWTHLPIILKTLFDNGLKTASSGIHNIRSILDNSSFPLHQLYKVLCSPQQNAQGSTISRSIRVSRS